GEAELGRVRLAHDDEPGALQADGELTVVVDHEVLEQRAAEAGDDAVIVRAQIFQEIGNARERSGADTRRDCRASLLVQTTHHGVDVGRRPVHPSEPSLPPPGPAPPPPPPPPPPAPTAPPP